MPSISIGATNLAALEAAVLAFSVANPTARITGANFLCRDMVGVTGLEMIIGLHYDLNGIDLTGTPLLAQTFQADSPTDLNAQILAWEVATVPVVESAPFIDYLAQRRRTKDYVAVIAYSMSQAAAENWLAEGNQGYTTFVDDTDSPYQASPYETVMVDAAGGDVDVLLPAVLAGTVTVKRLDAGITVVTVDPVLLTIDGNANHLLAAQYDAITVTRGDGEWSALSFIP